MEVTLDFDACVGGCVERDCVCLHCFPLGGARALGRVVALWGDSLIVCDLVSKRQKPSTQTPFGQALGGFFESG